MLECARRYPQILVHSLITNMSVVPPDHLVLGDDKDSSRSAENGMKLEEWIIEGGIGRTSYVCNTGIAEL